MFLRKGDRLTVKTSGGYLYTEKNQCARRGKEKDMVMKKKRWRMLGISMLMISMLGVPSATAFAAETMNEETIVDENLLEDMEQIPPE